ncbi:MAG: phosphate--nucleotide phosphotransferase [Pelodictyon luteolum]|uniref:Phosphate--nucleotide phosphotransferase n=1 Tax=Pelodictyon luteolum TaxID=1100 RepID=A0A165M477_PELLU|nr:ADP-polyphosphate phosphotransferase [Pelodictyon luteolum]KZK74794.1 MAG: phosphate--nucleotide phosphotransferase [Pelodictyon luteolum]
MDSLLDTSVFRVAAGDTLDLSSRPTLAAPLYSSGKQYRELLSAQVTALSELQAVHYADNRYAVLLVFQAMDAAGKDSCIRHVMTGVNPQGCEVHSFQHPSMEEHSHDFLWRTTCALPSRGRIGIFNRSYYEEVLIVRVHPEILESEGIANGHPRKEDVWEARFRSINDMERHLHANGTRIVKFFLHLSKEEQRLRFLKRIDRPAKNWKFSMSDIEERRYWDEYMAAYAACLSATSSADAPWYIVPADDKRNARLIVSSILLDLFKGLDLRYPVATGKRKKELQACRRVLLAE